MPEVGYAAQYIGVNQGYPIPYASNEGTVSIPISQIDQGPSKLLKLSTKRYQPPRWWTDVPSIATTSAITAGGGGSTDMVDIDLTTTSPLGLDLASGNGSEYWIIEPGTANQEILYVQGAWILNATQLRTWCIKNHAAGVPLVKMTSFYTVYFGGAISSIPLPNGIGDLTFIQMSKAPNGVYVQYKLRGTTTTSEYVLGAEVWPYYSGSVEADSTTPIPIMPVYDTGSLDANLIPTNGVSINAGPIAPGSGSYALRPNVQVQFLFTTKPEPDISSVDFAYFWRPL